MSLLRNFNNPQYWQEMEFYRFSIMMFIITFGTAFSSVSVYYLFQLKQDVYDIPVALVALFAMGANASAIAQSPLKWVVGIFLLSMIISVVFIFYAFFA